MNGFHKNKGIVIELTALLDVILIMLFWVIMDMQDNSEKIREDADSRIASAESMLEEERKNAESRIEQINADAQSRIDEAMEKAEDLDSRAAGNQQALDGYKQGLLVTLNLKYNNGGRLFISKAEDELGSVSLAGNGDISSEIINALDGSGLSEGDAVLCAFVYDGSSALYRDVQNVISAVERVTDTYENFYCTYINTTR